ncbi:MAG: DUF3089 domain-containing protein [Saprospiraceae bacterium]|nr:DUF3089 domain-containing protein [Saprospiraceae bacterium]
MNFCFRLACNMRFYLICFQFLLSTLIWAQNHQSLDYSDLNLWAAHPSKKDSADLTPLDLEESQQQAEADVFFIHPTSYGGLKLWRPWNAEIQNKKINRKTDNFIIKNQATIFNEVGKIYAPRYRQAHFYAFLTGKEDKKEAALDFAYLDIKDAFEYYITHFNNGRPIIIAAHSQGSLHAVKLLQEYFDNTNLRNRLVVAYLPGMPISKHEFKNIPPCTSEYQTNCFCSWRTFKEGSKTSWGKNISDVLVTNPISWKLDTVKTLKDQHKGMVLYNFHSATTPHAIQAKVQNNILWVNKPKFKGSFLLVKKNYHQGDYNLFYVNVRENARKRLNAFWKG